MHWLWLNRPTADDEAMIYETPEIVDEQNLSFDEGARIAQAVPRIVIVRDSDSQGTLTDNLIGPDALGLLLSSRLREILGKAGVSNIDYYPCRVTNPLDGTASDDYRIANVVGLIACVDFEASELVMHPRFPDQIQFIDKLVLRESAIGDALMFRLAEFSTLVVVDEKVKKACEAAKVTGVCFYPPEEAPL